MRHPLAIALSACLVFPLASGENASPLRLPCIGMIVTGIASVCLLEA